MPKNRKARYQFLRSGFSLLEMMVVLSVFALLAIISSQALILTLQGTKKSNSLAEVRENLDFSVQVVERQLHNASEVQPCPNTDTKNLIYKDQEGREGNFSCEVDDNGIGYIASGSGRLTSDAINITSCDLVCAQETEGTPPYVEISATARDIGQTDVSSSSVTTSTRVFLRTY